MDDSAIILIHVIPTSYLDQVPTIFIRGLCIKHLFALINIQHQATRYHPLGWLRILTEEYLK